MPYKTLMINIQEDDIDAHLNTLELNGWVLIAVAQERAIIHLFLHKPLRGEAPAVRSVWQGVGDLGEASRKAAEAFNKSKRKDTEDA